MSFLNKIKPLTNLTLEKSYLCILKKNTRLPLYQNVSSPQKLFSTRYLGMDPVCDGPDYSFLDGRKTPLRYNQRKRAIKQKENMEKAFKLLKEVEFAVQRHKNMNEAEKEDKRKVIESKLKEKAFEYEWVKNKKKNT